MNNWTTRSTRILPWAGLALLQLAGCTSFQTVDKTKVATVSLAELQAEMTQRKETWKLPEHGVILKIGKGASLPLTVQLATALTTIEPASNRIRFEQDCYLFVSTGAIKLSLDGERWADMGDWRTFRRLLGGSRGYLRIGVGISREDGPLISIAAGVGER